MNFSTDAIVILLIDDNENYKKEFLHLLKAHKAHINDIIIPQSVFELEQLLKKDKPDIIFTCFNENNTNEVYVNILKELTIQIPLITVSNNIEEQLSLKSMFIGADDHLFRYELSAPLLWKVIAYNMERKKNSQLLNEAVERYHLFVKATNDIAWDWEIEKRSATWIGNGIQNILKYPYSEMIVETDFWENHLHPDDKERVLNKLNEVFKQGLSTKWEDEYRFRNNEGEYRHIYDRGFIIYNNKVPIRMLGSMVDITARINLEKKLEIENSLKQTQITEAVITAQEKERSEIGQELHDNVNQMLSASRLYIDAANADNENRPFLLSQSSSYIKKAIEEIRTLSKVLHSPLINEIGLIESIDNLSDEIMAVNDIDISILANNFDEEKYNNNFKLTIYRIIQEQITNILKHAKASAVNITISHNQYDTTVEIKDDGVGFDTRKKRQGIGINNIVSRASLYNGTMKLDSVPEKGSTLIVQFKEKDALISK